MRRALDLWFRGTGISNYPGKFAAHTGMEVWKFCRQRYRAFCWSCSGNDLDLQLGVLCDQIMKCIHRRNAKNRSLTLAFRPRPLSLTRSLWLGEVLYVEDGLITRRKAENIDRQSQPLQSANRSSCSVGRVGIMPHSTHFLSFESIYSARQRHTNVPGNT